MFGAFGQRYPLLEVLGTSVLLALAALPLSQIAPLDRPLSPLSVMAFLAALGCCGLPVLQALLHERSSQEPLPFWRFRYAATVGYFWFVSLTLLTGMRLPSVEATQGVAAAVVFGVLMASIVPTTSTQATRALVDIKAPFRTNRADEVLWQLWGAVLMALALALSLFDGPGTPTATFVLLIAFGVLWPHPLRNRRRGRVLLPVLGIGLALIGAVYA